MSNSNGDIQKRIEQAKALLSGTDYLLYVKDSEGGNHILEYTGNPVAHLETVDHMLVINAQQEIAVRELLIDTAQDS